MDSLNWKEWRERSLPDPAASARMWSGIERRIGERRSSLGGFRRAVWFAAPLAAALVVALGSLREPSDALGPEEAFWASAAGDPVADLIPAGEIVPLPRLLPEREPLVALEEGEDWEGWLGDEWWNA